jgi:hypothetical protein
MLCPAIAKCACPKLQPSDQSARERLMPILKVIAAGAIAGVLANITGYIITARLFHRYQAQTPATWRRAESWTHYLYSAGLRLLACVAVAFFYSLFAAGTPGAVDSAIPRGLGFAALLWMAAAAPVILETALFVNWHRGFVVGLLLDWLVLCLIAGTVSSLVT